MIKMLEKIKVKRARLWPVIISGIQICVYILGIGLIVWIAIKIGSSIGSGAWPPAIEKIGSWSQIVVAYAAIFAIGQYAVAYSEVTDRKTRTVLELVKFFRENVITSGDLIRRKIKNNKQYQLPCILLRKNTPHLEFTQEDFFNRISPNQKIEIEKYAQIITNDYELDESIRSGNVHTHLAVSSRMRKCRSIWQQQSRRNGYAG